MEKFEDFFGQKVNLSFLGGDRVISLPEGFVLGEGTVLQTVKSRKKIVVGEEITSSGGQGIIYKSEDPRLVIKLYRDEARTLHIEKKLKKMIQFENHNPSICWPIDVLETFDGTFVGFIMPLVDGKNLYSLTTNPSRVMRKYPSFSRTKQVDILIQTVELFQNLHEINVIVGDVKLENIMFSDKYKVTLIDIDSVQVGEFPCDSSTPGYDPPEIIICRGIDNIAQTYPDGTLAYNSYYRDFYRNLDHERYALTVLIYRFLMNGQKPFDYQDWGKVSDENITYNDDELCVKKQFAYSDSTAPSKDAIEKEIWSHLPSFIKNAFVRTFAYNERFSDEDWLKMLKRYKQLLSSELRSNDNECDAPFPVSGISYENVVFPLLESIERSGFAMIQAIARIEKALNKQWDRKTMISVSNALQNIPDITMGSYRFQLVYNIGVLKKIKCDPVL